MEILSQDWDALENAADRVGFPAERIGSLRRRLENPPPRPGSPYTLLIGRPEAGLPLLLPRWLDAEADLLREIGERPVVLGKTPGEVCPKLGTWGTRKGGKLAAGHLILLQTPGKPTATVLAQIASLGYLDQVLLVTRLGQPLSLKEREIARALAPLAATARVLVVALPGEETTGSESTEVSAYAQSQMRQAGFDGGRYLGTAVWFTDGKARPGTITDPGKLLALDPAVVLRGRSQMASQAFADLLRDLRERAEKAPAAAPVTIPFDEQERLVRELGSYLSDLGKELERQKTAGRVADMETLRAYARDALRGWGAYLGVEGHWMKYVERLRPGMQAAFLAEADSALELLQYEPGSAPAEAAQGGGALPSGLLQKAKRASVGFGSGLISYLSVGALVHGDGLAQSAENLLSSGALLVGGFLGYSVSGFLFRNPRTARPEDAEPPRPATIHGWQQVERRLLAWLGDQIRARPSSPLEEVTALSERLRLEEIHS